MQHEHEVEPRRERMAECIWFGSKVAIFAVCALVLWRTAVDAWPLALALAFAFLACAALAVLGYVMSDCG